MLIVALLVSVIGILIDVTWLTDGGTDASLLFFNLLPGLVLAGIWYAGRTWPTWQRLIHWLGLPLVGILLPWLALGNLGMVFTDRSGQPITTVSRYPELMRRHREGAGPVLRHFPETIPADARLVRFYFMPRFLQGPMLVELRLQLPPARLPALLKGLGTARLNPGSDISAEQVMAGGFRNDDNTGFEPLPEDFRLQIFDSGTDGPEGNHRHSYGMAVSERRSELIYWGRSW